jgi:hypothetical protein
MDSRRDWTPEFIAARARDVDVSRSGLLFLITRATRLLLVAVACALYGSQAQGLPLGFGCAPPASDNSPVECQPVLFRSVLGPVLPGTISQEAFVRLIVDTDATSSKFLNSLDSSSTGLLSNAASRASIQFSLTTDHSETGVVARMENAPVGSAMDEVALNSGAGDALAEQFPVPRAATLLLISSGLALTATRRRRGSPMLDEQAVWALRKEVSSATSVTRLFCSTRQLSHSNPLRI